MSLVSFLRERIATRRQAALSDYAKAVTAADGEPTGKEADKLEAVLATAGKTVDDLATDAAAYQRALILAPAADDLPEAQAAYEAARAALAEFDIETAAEVARRTVTNKMRVEMGSIGAGAASDELSAIDRYKIDRQHARAVLEHQRRETGKAFNVANAAAQEWSALRDRLASIGITV